MSTKSESLVLMVNVNYSSSYDSIAQSAPPMSRASDTHTKVHVFASCQEYNEYFALEIIGIANYVKNAIS